MVFCLSLQASPAPTITTVVVTDSWQRHTTQPPLDIITPANPSLSVMKQLDLESQRIAWGRRSRGTICQVWTGRRGTWGLMSELLLMDWWRLLLLIFTVPRWEWVERSSHMTLELPWRWDTERWVIQSLESVSRRSSCEARVHDDVIFYCGGRRHKVKQSKTKFLTSGRTENHSCLHIARTCLLGVFISCWLWG